MASILIAHREELRAEIRRLTDQEDEQRIALKNRFRSPVSIFNSILTLFPKSSAAQGVPDLKFFQQDFLSLISRFLLPLTLNKTLFRRSGILVKMLVALISQKAAAHITEETVEKIFERGGALIAKLRSAKQPASSQAPLNK